MIENYKHQLIQFRLALRPFFDLMDHKQIVFPTENWLRFVTSVRDRVVESPEQFLGKEFPSPEVLKQIIGDIFDEYLTENLALNSVELS